MYAFAPERLQEWFAHLDGEPEAAAAIAKIQDGQDFLAWFEAQAREQRLGIQKLQWPPDNDRRLGMQLLLFRAVAREGLNVGALGKKYVPGSGRNINDNTRAFIDQIFRPMSRELVRYLRRVGQAEMEAERSAPAADRVVTLDHNSDPYLRTLEALDELIRALQGANDYPDPDDKEQHLAEVEATKTLLKPKRVSVAAVVSVIGGGLVYLTTHFVGTAVDMAAHNVIDALISLFGAVF